MSHAEFQARVRAAAEAYVEEFFGESVRDDKAVGVIMGIFADGAFWFKAMIENEVLD